MSIQHCRRRMAPSFLEVVPSRNSSTFFFGNPHEHPKTSKHVLSRWLWGRGILKTKYGFGTLGDNVVNHIPYPEKVTHPTQTKNTNMGGLLWNTVLQNWIWLMVFGLPHVFKLQSNVAVLLNWWGYDVHESSYLNLGKCLRPDWL